MLKNKGLGTKLIAGFLFVGLVPFAIMGGFSYLKSSGALSDQAYSQLGGLFEIKQEQVSDFFTGCRSDLRTLTANMAAQRQEAFRKLRVVQELKKRQVLTLIRGMKADAAAVAVAAEDAYADFRTYAETAGAKATGDLDVASETYRQVYDRHFGDLSSLCKQEGYNDVYVVCWEHGHVLFTQAKGSDLGQNVGQANGPQTREGLGQLWRKVRKSRTTEIVDFDPYTPAAGTPAAFVGAPVLDDTGEPVALVALQVPHGKIQTIIGNREGLGETGETYLLAEDPDSSTGLEFRSNMVTMGDGAYVLGAEMPHTEYIDKVTSGESVEALFADSSGALVLVCGAPLDIDGLDWGCISKINGEEAFVPTVEGERDDYLTKYIAEYGYHDAFLISPSGYCFYTVAKEADYCTNLRDGKYSASHLGALTRKILETHRFGFADFAPYAPSDNRPQSFIAEPVLYDGKVEMIVALQLREGDVTAMLQRGSSKERKLESYLVGPDRLMRSDSLLTADYTVENSFAEGLTVDTEAVTKALDGEEGHALIDNYEGHPVLSAFGPVDVFGTRYALVSDEDEGTAFAAARSMRTASLVIAVLATGGILAIAIGLTRSIANPIQMVIEGLTSGSEQVTSASVQLSSASQSLSESSSEQASSLEETSSSLEEMSSQTKQTADNADQAEKAMKEAGHIVGSGVDAMKRMSAAMDEIRDSSEQTSKIIKTIDDIAFQTNLLALNAAVEAARAGEAGKGFAVVAEEVRNLAQRSAEAARNTSELIEKSQHSSENGVQVAEEVSGNLNSIKDSAGKVGTLVEEIAAAAKEQSQGIDQINAAVAEMDKSVQQNASTSEESASAAEELSSQAEELNSMVEELAAIVGGNAGADRGAAPGKRHNAAQSADKTTDRAVESHAVQQKDVQTGGESVERRNIRRQLLSTGKKNNGDRNPEEIIPMGDEDFGDF